MNSNYHSGMSGVKNTRTARIHHVQVEPEPVRINPPGARVGLIHYPFSAVLRRGKGPLSTGVCTPLDAPFLNLMAD
jgi:hypothetical protein